MPHTPVLLKEVIKFLDPKPGEFIIDGTVNGGGHAAEIIKKVSPKGKLLGVDWDEAILSGCRARFSGYENVILVRGNYADLPEILRIKELGKADGLLLDLGFSTVQLDEGGKGFSFAKNEPLLMTYDADAKPVREVLKELGEKELAEIIFRFSGEKFAGRIAKAIKKQERLKPIETTAELRKIIESAVPGNYEHGRLEPSTRTFQALRIYANNELGNLEKILNGLTRILKKGGRVVVISFHSLEDRVVKRALRILEKNGQFKVLTKKPVVAGRNEVAQNPKSRSAKLRSALIL
jgi:16S rRNA (cytosine1402-N4)-methyltransferase